jgi:phospholipid/cholesterol/gamma-HCH transport system substrate-binding protein
VRNLGPSVKVGITFLVVAGLGYWAFSMLTKGGCGREENELRVHAYFQDATGLVEKSMVQISGLNVGHIASRELNVRPPRRELAEKKRFAKIQIALEGSVALYENAAVVKRQTSLLGGYYLEIDPGTPSSVDDSGKERRNRRLAPGDEIRGVEEAASTDRLIRQINDTIPVLRLIAEDIRVFTRGPLHSISNNINDSIKENRDSVKAIVSNMEGITDDIHRITSGASGDVNAILKDIRETTSAIRGIVGRSDKDVAETTQKVKSGLDKLVAAIDKLDTALTDVKGITGDVKGITGDVQDGKGTVGRLLKDDALINDIEGTVHEAGGFVHSLTSLQTIVGLRSEYNFLANTIKTYVSVEIRPRPDKYYLIELIQDPRGARKVTTTLTRSDDPSKPLLTREEQVEITNAFRFTFQFAKRISFAGFRFGIKENTGGVGVDFYLWKDRIKFETDLFDFSANVWPRLKVLAAWEFFQRLYVVGGVDDAFNSRPIDGSAGGRDFFVGAQLRFNDEDLKALLLFGGGLVSGAASK